MIRRCPLVPTLLALACLAPGADLAWSGAPGDQAPAGWSVTAGPAPKGKLAAPVVRFVDGAVEISAPSATRALASAVLDLPDATDDQPVRVSALVSASGDRPVEGSPALVAVTFAGGAVFAVGLGDDPHLHRDERRAWAMWSGGTSSGQVHAESEFGSGPVPVRLRIVITATRVTAFGSLDGWNWTRVAGVDRAAIGATGPAQRLVLGRGRVDAPGLAADPPAGPSGQRAGQYRFADLRAEHGQAEIPASLTSRYAKLESYADTIESLARPGRPTAWRLRGPEAVPRGGMPVVLPEGEGGEWRDATLPENERILQLGRLLNGPGGAMRWASTAVRAESAGWFRILFDGMRRSWLYIDGRLAGGGDRDRDVAEPDRQAVLVWLPAGEHRISLAVRGDDGRCAAVLRWEPGDPLYRIALLRRLLIDFPDEADLASAPFEIARLWEGLGFAREAAEALAEQAKRGDDPEAAEHALTERARLYHQIGDAAAAGSEIEQLNRLWAASETDRLATVGRTARLWQRLDAPAQALGALAEALKLPDLSAQARSGVAVERARLFRRIGDDAGAANELRSAAAMLPADAPGRFDLLCAAARIESAGGGDQAVQALAGLVTTATRGRMLAGIQAARKDDAARLAARAAAAKLPPDCLDLPAVDLAESLLVAKDQAGAEQAYRQALAQIGGKPTGDSLPRLRADLLRAVLAERPAGQALLAAADAVPRSEQTALRWRLAGPWRLQGWKTFDTPPFDPAKVDPATASGGKPWTDPPAEAMSGDAIDLTRAGMSDDSVMFLAATVDSAGERRVMASAGADDGLSVWVNGARVYSDRVQRPLSPDSIAFPVQLRAGRNVIVCAVQNGNGASGFQMRLRREPWPAGDIADALAALGGDEAGRIVAGNRLTGLCEQLRAAERLAEAEAVARAVLRLWPDDPDRQQRVANGVLWDQAWSGCPDLVRELASWYDALCADRAWDNAGLARGVAELMPLRLAEVGHPADAVARLRRSAATGLDPGPVAMAQLSEADIWLRAGFARQAAAAAGQAATMAAGDEALVAEAERRLRTAKAMRKDQLAVSQPFELVNALRTAERAATSGDPERAAADWAKVIDGGRDQPVQVGGGRLRGAAQYAAARLRRTGGAVLAAWRDRFDRRASEAFARCAEADDPMGCERVVSRWPLASCAGDALARAADGWAARGAWQLALGAARQALAEQPAARLRVLARAAHAAARAGEREALAAMLADIAAGGTAVPWDGAELTPARFAEAMRALLPASTAEPDPSAVAVAVRLLPDTDAVGRAARVGGTARLATGAVADGRLLAATTSDLVSVDAATGALRWRLAGDPAPAGAAPGGGDAIAMAAVEIESGLAVARLQRGGAMRLVAVDASTGRQLWSSAGIPELADLAAMSAPRLACGRVWAWFATRGRSLVACLSAEDGAVLWASALAAGPVPQPIPQGVELTLTGHAAAPLLSGRELVVSTDAGLVGCLDATTGQLIWLNAYPRSGPEPIDGGMALARLQARGAGVIAADAKRIYVAPRDTLSVLALDRASGETAWSADLTDAREIAGLTAGGLVLAGTGVTCLDQATGLERWRWAPAPGAPRLLGRPALTATTAWAGTQAGLVRIALADGSASEGPAWKSLGLDGDAPAALTPAAGGLLACGNGTIALLRPGGPGAVTDLAAKVLPLARPTGIEAAKPGVRPAAVAAAWELPLGRTSVLHRPADAAGGEIYAVAGDAVLRLDGITGRPVWSMPAPTADWRGLQVAGQAVLALSGPVATVFDRASGRLLWSASLDGDLRRQMMQGRWNPVSAMLAADGLLSYRSREDWWVLRNPGDGTVRGSGKSDGGMCGARMIDGRLHLVVVRGRDLWLEVRDPLTGARRSEADLKIRGDDWASVASLPDGSMLIANTKGSSRWLPATQEVQPLERGLASVIGSWNDGGRFTVASWADSNRYYSTILDPASGRVLAHDKVSEGWARSWQERSGYLERMVGDIRVRGGETRGEHVGLSGRRLEGGEAWWIQIGARWSSMPIAVLPLDGLVLALTGNRDGRIRAQLVDAAAGTLVVDSLIPGTVPWPIPPPIDCGGTVVYGTMRGLAGLVPSAAPLADADPAAEPVRREASSWARRPSVEPLALWRTAAPRIDGLLGDWADASASERPSALAIRAIDDGAATPEGGVRSRLSWGDDGLRIALELPLPPAAVDRALLAIDLSENEFRGGDPPLLIDLAWRRGLPEARIVASPMSDDPARPRVQAGASGIASTSWEVLIPWGWIWPHNDRRPSREHGLRAGAAVWTHDAQGRAFALEWGDGLVRGLDKAGLVRLRLEEKRPEPKPGKR